MRRETIQRVPTPTAILVGVPEDLAVLCTDALGETGLRVLKVGHAAAASARIPVIMPQLVLVGILHPDELEMLNDRCVAVGAQVLTITKAADPRAMTAAVRAAATAALDKALRARQ